MPKPIRERDAIDRMLDMQQRELELAAAPAPVAPGMDREGAPPIEQLARFEANARLRFSPRRLRWRDVQALDEEVAGLEQRTTATAAELNDTRTRQASADQADADRVAEWLAAGSKGERPEPTKPTLEARVAELETEHAALGELVDRALRTKGDYIRRHRGRLGKLARQYVEAAQAEAHRLIDELATARDKLAAARESELWLACFGEEHATRMPNARLLCGARKEPLMRAGIHSQVDADRVLAALHDDADWLARMATTEQAKALDSAPPDLRAPGVAPMSEGITLRHARSCRHRQTRCTCSPTYQAQVWDAAAGKRITETFPTISAARRWRQDAYAALRAGTLTADRGQTLAEAADDWLAAASAGIVRTRSGDVYKPAAIRSYEQVLRLHVLPTLGHERLREITLPQLQRFVDRLAADGLAPATITTAVTPLRAIYRRARQLGEVHANPTSGISVPAVDRPSDAVRHDRPGRGDVRAARERQGSRTVVDRALRGSAPR